MRLLHAKSLQLKEFFESEIPEYAILSHTWEREEVLFQDMNNLDAARMKQGYAKVQGACALALSRGYKYIWIDTCCIDKSSSAELTEAINSMYRWYEAAAVCFAYLSDVERNSSDREARFRESRWFTRGWTLQELIAPSIVEFYSREWTGIGEKKTPDLSRRISDITGIDVHTLLGGSPAEVSIARRMYWASGRQTTRVEDQAYSLLGLFGVNMPMIYGEGTRAFRRLQEEILKMSDDQSIFAWHNPAYSEGSAIDVLASSPSDFAYSGTLSREPFYRVGRKPTTITNQGITVELPIMSVTRLDSTEFQPFDEVEAILDCQMGTVPGTFPTIRLRSIRNRGGNESRHYYRVMTGEMTKFEYYDKRALHNDVPVLGLDPTQLHKDEYRESLDKNYLRWKMESVIFVRNIPQMQPRQSGEHGETRHMPWSLSLLAADYPPDDTGYWLLAFRTMKYEPTITAVFPSDRWDASSMQFRVMPIPRESYGIGHFCIVDGLIDIEFYYPTTELWENRHILKHGASLLLGRKAESRRTSPRPWCHFLEERVPHPQAEEYIKKLPDTRVWRAEEDVSTLRLGLLNYAIEASVRSKEISGVFHHVVAIRPTTLGEEPITELYLLNR